MEETTQDLAANELLERLALAEDGVLAERDRADALANRLSAFPYNLVDRHCRFVRLMLVLWLLVFTLQLVALAVWAGGAR